MNKNLFRIFLLLILLIIAIQEVKASDFSFYENLATSFSVNTPYCTESHREFCNLIEIKSWPHQEQAWVYSEISKLEKLGLGHILKNSIKNGFAKVVRATYGFGIGISLQEPLKRETNHFAFVDEDRGWIVLLDLFFNYPVEKDPISNISKKSLTFLHELVHTYDKTDSISTHPQFLKATGFEGSHPHYDFNKVSKSDKELQFNVILDYKSKNQFQESELFERTFAIQHGFPRIYSMKSPQEALADLTAYLFYDSNSKAYINSDIINYIDSKILLGARNY